MAGNIRIRDEYKENENDQERQKSKKEKKKHLRKNAKENIIPEKGNKHES